MSADLPNIYLFVNANIVKSQIDIVIDLKKKKCQIHDTHASYSVSRIEKLTLLSFAYTRYPRLVVVTHPPNASDPILFIIVSLLYTLDNS